MRVTRREFLHTASQISGGAVLGGIALATASTPVGAQANTEQLAPILKDSLQTPDVVEYQLRQYLMNRVRPLSAPANAEEWTSEAARLREHALELIFHGWPKDWVTAPPRFEETGVIPGKGYLIRKLRFEIVPGFWSTALLYEPQGAPRKYPATLNLNGHTPQGKAAEYKQKRCINNALQGIYALSLEWLGMGELGIPENSHWNGAHLNLVGVCATGLFYLAMRKGLDYLCSHPAIDTARVAVTGLSGGGWQTITLSALDQRALVAIPVSGYFALISAIERNSDVGDMEYNTPDLGSHCDGAVLTALRAPRPTLLIYGAEDEYGIRAPLEKPHLYDDVKPFFHLYRKDDDFAWYENIEPGTHNYQLDNRERSYAFITQHFRMPVVNREIVVDDQIKTTEELAVGLPAENLTILSLARRISSGYKRSDDAINAESMSSARARLEEIVHYAGVSVKHAWPASSTRIKGVETQSYRFEFNNGLSATAVWLKSTIASGDAPIILVIDDDGFQRVRSEANLDYVDPADISMSDERRANSIASHINRGEQVLALNTIFIGDSSPDKLGEPKSLWEPSTLYTQLLSFIGERPIGIEAGQLIGATKWLQERTRSQMVRLESTGIRTQTLALVAAALEPVLYTELTIREGISSFSYLLEKPVHYQDAPELFCLDLYKTFDINALSKLSHPTKVVRLE